MNAPKLIGRCSHLGRVAQVTATESHTAVSVDLASGGESVHCRARQSQVQTFGHVAHAAASEGCIDTS